MAMTYFQNIHSLADLKKKEYRRLAWSTTRTRVATLQSCAVNTEFGRLLRAWKRQTRYAATSTGYEYDLSGSHGKEEYTEYVYNEYRWKGRNYKGQHTRH